MTTHGRGASEHRERIRNSFCDVFIISLTMWPRTSHPPQGGAALFALSWRGFLHCSVLCSSIHGQVRPSIEVVCFDVIDPLVLKTTRVCTRIFLLEKIKEEERVNVARSILCLARHQQSDSGIFVFAEMVPRETFFFLFTRTTMTGVRKGETKL